MALVTVNEIRLYVRAPNVAEVTAEITLLRSMAVAAIETELGRAIDGTGRTFGSPQPWPVFPSFRGPSDGDTTTVTTGTARVALSTLGDYTGRYEGLASSWILDVVADRWRRRNPNATSESAAGISVSYDSEGLPPRVRRSIHRLRTELG